MILKSYRPNLGRRDGLFINRKPWIGIADERFLVSPAYRFTAKGPRTIRIKVYENHRLEMGTQFKISIARKWIAARSAIATTTFLA